MAATTTPQPVRLEDYAPPAYLIEHIDLRFELAERDTRVTATSRVRRNPGGPGGPLVLDGQDVELLSLRLDGSALDAGAYAVGPESLTVADVSEVFTLEVVTRLRPADNTALEGLYVSNGTFCTQCEAEGFRKITYFPDRPDVMARYTVRLEADKAACPVLLSNGNRVAGGDLDGGRHYAVWDDPFPKPSYLFALVAGDLGHVADGFTTRSGREVSLRVYTEPHNTGKCGHAMASLKRAMRWDEDVFGLEYDLDEFNVVAVGDFNMGAMENKGLNIFNTKYVLASPETATDADFMGVEAVVAHEYFHNWTGNRVTCRDWFQLSLKEGLTVFRDQQYTADVVTSPAVKRIADVQRLRATQFAEDAGPLAHPVRPDSYVEINNFYTTTVYEKGAEVVRMIHTLIGADAFRRGIGLYFERHDGQAVTCEDFVAAMADASGRDLKHFFDWYRQAGTPQIEVRGEHDGDGNAYRLHVRQHTAPTPGQPDKRPLHVPLALALLDENGEKLPLRLADESVAAGDERVIELRDEAHTFVFENVQRPPVPSLLRGFSAPVNLDAGYHDGQLAFLLAHDDDPFARWEAGQTLATKVLLGLVEALAGGRLPALPEAFLPAFTAPLRQDDLDPAYAAQLLTLPSEGYLGQRMAVVDVDGIHAARQLVRTTLAAHARGRLLETYQATRGNDPRSLDPVAIGRRALGNLCLAYLMAGGDEEAARLCAAQYEGAATMTDSVAALSLLAESDLPQREPALAGFFERWRDEPLVVDKWFAVQATAQRPDAVERVRALLDHPAFSLSNPNRARSLIGAFAFGNPTGFHRADGAGYAFLGEQVRKLDPRNPQIAARLLGALNRWRRYDEGRGALMRGELERVLAAPSLSRDSYEIAAKSLGKA